MQKKLKPLSPATILDLIVYFSSGKHRGINPSFMRYPSPLPQQFPQSLEQLPVLQLPPPSPSPPPPPPPPPSPPPGVGVSALAIISLGSNSVEMLGPLCAIRNIPTNMNVETTSGAMSSSFLKLFRAQSIDHFAIITFRILPFTLQVYSIQEADGSLLIHSIHQYKGLREGVGDSIQHRMSIIIPQPQRYLLKAPAVKIGQRLV